MRKDEKAKIRYRMKRLARKFCSRNNVYEEFDGSIGNLIEKSYLSAYLLCLHENKNKIVELEAVRPKWHDLRKDPNDLPKSGQKVLANNISTIECVVFKKEADGNYWRHDMFELRHVVKWCDAEQFLKEEYYE